MIQPASTVSAGARAPFGEWFAAALAHFGPQHWWPGDSPFEVCVGAVLTQNTNWGNVERAIANLKRTENLSAARLHALDHEALAQLIRPAGYFNVKARRLKNFVSLLMDEFGGNLDRIWALGVERARERLLSVSGIGEETADSMLLYAGGLPIFVCDAYTRRILARHGLCPDTASYAEMQTLFHDQIERDPTTYNECHALIVAIGKHYCRPRNPNCSACPLGPSPFAEPRH